MDNMLILQEIFSVLMLIMYLMLLTIRIHELKKFLTRYNDSKNEEIDVLFLIRLIAGIIIAALSMAAIVFMAVDKSIDILLMIYVMVPAILCVNYVFYIDSKKMKGLYISFKGFYCTSLVITSLSQYLKGSTDILVLGFWFTIAFAIFDIPLIKEEYDMLFNKVEDR